MSFLITFHHRSPLPHNIRQPSKASQVHLTTLLIVILHEMRRCSSFYCVLTTCVVMVALPVLCSPSSSLPTVHSSSILIPPPSFTSSAQISYFQAKRSRNGREKHEKHVPPLHTQTAHRESIHPSHHMEELQLEWGNHSHVIIYQLLNESCILINYIN